jgi:hypothetical protein
VVVLLAGCVLALGVAAGAAFYVKGLNQESNPADDHVETADPLTVAANDASRPVPPSQPDETAEEKVTVADEKTGPANPLPSETQPPTPVPEPSAKLAPEHPSPPIVEPTPTPPKLPEPKSKPPTPKPKPPVTKQPIPKASPIPPPTTPKKQTPSDIANRLLADAPKDLPKLNRGVLAYAVDRFGQKVGRGECWDLAAYALKAIGARRAKGYTFGQRVKLEELKPGDILQFHKARFETTRFWQLLGAPHHTAVVAAVADSKIVLLHQNIGTKRFVLLGQIDLKNLQTGTVLGFRAVPR